MDRSDDLRAFVTVVEAGSFAEAARRLRLSPSAVSKLVGRLETRLGARLLHRTTRSLAPTLEGRAYVERGRELLADMDALEASIAQSAAEPTGLLSVTMPHGLGMTQIMPLIPGFVSRYPRVELRLNFADHVVDLIAEGQDVAFRLGAVGHDSLIARRLADHWRLVCAAPAYLARRGTPRHPEALAGHACTIYETADRLNSWLFRMPDGSPAEFTATRGPRSNNGEAVLALVRAGLAIGSLSDYLIADDLAEGRLIPLLTEFAIPEPSAIYLVYPHRRHLASRVRAFVDYIVAAFTPRPPWQRIEILSRPS